MHLIETLKAAFEPVLSSLSPDPAKVPDYLAMIKPAQDAKHGDYQANVAMPLAKVLGKKPPEVANDVIGQLPLGDMLETPQVAGPGFINIRFQSEWLARQVRAIATDERLGVPLAPKAKTYVVDYSGPNVAKPLHVGHLRSTIIGESLCRLLRFLGHTAIGDNHLGDWGTQFGMLLYGYKNYLDRAAYDREPVQELARVYVHVRNLTKGTDDEETDTKTLSPEEQAVLDACRHETVKLHRGDPENVAIWKEFMPPCMEEVKAIYRRLDVKFDHQLGESFYQPMLGAVVEDLKAKGVAFESRGAIVVGDEKQISIVQKSDGAFTYTTTDLATIKYRADTFKPDAMLYVVDFRQADHFRQLFKAAAKWGYSEIELAHLQFGSVLGEDGKPLQTRKGTAAALENLLDTAIARGAELYESNRQERIALGKEVPELSDDERAQIAEAVGLGAVKYADLSQNRTSNYTFSYKKMLATEGNTATYMQYAYARCRSIFRKGEVDEARFRTDPPPVVLVEPEERGVALQLLRYPEYLQAAATEYMPHSLTAYLWDLTKALSSFYAADRCAVLKAETPELRESRLLLCDLSARIIRQTLHLLGIRTLERM
jgi:arginyl-tRNA synthetase